MRAGCIYTAIQHLSNAESLGVGVPTMTDKPAGALPTQADHTDWDSIARRREFNDLVGLKKTFIIPAFVIFLVHLFALMILVGYFPELASTRVIGTVTLAYLFALSQ